VSGDFKVPYVCIVMTHRLYKYICYTFILFNVEGCGIHLHFFLKITLKKIQKKFGFLKKKKWKQF